jgi:hypothetical protein
MQQRRYRPGDVLDDYCPRERRITDHAIVAMIDDDIKQTRCVVCDAEHEYKDGKVPVQRRRKPPAALFSQVLEGLQGPQSGARLSAQSEPDAESDTLLDVDSEPVPVVAAAHFAAAPEREVCAAPVPSAAGEDYAEEPPVRSDDRPWRRQLIRAALPRPEGQQPQPTRQMPEFTVRQPSSARGPRHGHGHGQGHGRRHGAGGAEGNAIGPMRFGRDQGPAGQRPHNGRRRRRGKKQSS